jgi:penicillin-binding protein 2
LSIDMDLQEYGEKLMQNKWGGIVAIEPSSGEILALVSAPSYDPGLLVGRQRSRNYTKLYNDSIAKPLFDRGLLAQYPPGSPFKILTGLVGLQEKIIDTTTAFSCRNGASFGRKFQKCHDVGTFSLNAAIYKSCNTYFGRTYCNIVDKNNQQAKNVDNWRRHLLSFGLGQFIGIDMPIGKKGNIPASNLYDKVYNKSWTGATIRSNAIGQGEVLMTPIQLCNMMAAVANEGFYYVPHMVKKIEGKAIEENFREKRATTIDKKYFKPVKKGLWDVYNYGTADRLQSKEVLIAGKTGTAENYKKIGGKRVKLKDHSIFVAFAPIENPKIAIAVFIENGGFGATVAGPIATCMVEKYLLNRITRKDLEDRVLQKSLLGEYAKLYPRKAYDSIARKFNVPLDSIQKFKNSIPDSIPTN